MDVRVGLGMIARDSNGRVIAARSITLATIVELVIAEAQAPFYICSDVDQPRDGFYRHNL